MRVDTTVVEANLHYPTDSSLLGDGVRAHPDHDENHRHRCCASLRLSGTPKKR